MIIKTICNYFNDENTYIIHNDNSEFAVVIDPGCDVDLIDEYLNENNLKLNFIILTHCHYDHISTMDNLEKYGAKVIGGENCAINLKDSKINLSEVGLGYKLEKNVDIILKDNEEKDINGINVRCIYTPGHTSCSVCYLFEDNLFSGDTLFLRSVGRWDLPTGEHLTLEDSLVKKLYELDDEIKVYPGHGKATSIGYEKNFNLFIKKGM